MGKSFWLLDVVIYGFFGALTAILLDDSRAELLFHAAIFTAGAWALEFVWGSYGDGSYGSDDGDD